MILLLNQEVSLTTLVLNILIFQGYLHSGYPIMGRTDPKTLKLLNLKFLESNGFWGLFHEIGHNVQWISGFYVKRYKETTNNFWSLYVSQKVSNSKITNTNI